MVKQEFVIPISARERFQMQKRADEYEYIMAFTDGASLDNPGKSGAGVAFYGVRKASNELRTINESSGSEISEMSQDESNSLISRPGLFEAGAFDNIEGCLNPRLDHLFNCQLYLGIQTNNVAEYVGVILA